MKNKLYIAYGSNLNLPQMAKRCPAAKVVGTSEIKDFALIFRGQRGNAVATIESQKGSLVPVLIWEITPNDEISLDRYEGYPTFYEKDMLELPLNGQMVSAMVYVMMPGHRLGYPSDYYYNAIKEGYKTAGFDTEILAEAVNRTEQMMERESSPSQLGLGELKWW